MTCVATAAMWVVSYFAYDAIGFWPSPAQRRAYALISDRGTVCVASLAEGDGRSRWKWRHDPGPRRESMFGGTAGFVLHRKTHGDVVVGAP